MAFWLKRPGQWSDDAEPIGDRRDGEFPSSMGRATMSGRSLCRIRVMRG